MRSGKFKRTYKLKGKFKSKRKATGQVNVKTTSCNVTIKFSAKHK